MVLFRILKLLLPIRFLTTQVDNFLRWYGFAYTFPNCEIYEAI